MPIVARKNLYPGVNAHLHSFLQNAGAAAQPASWRGFHNHYVSQIMEYLNAQLPEGYIAVNEQSLQILGETDGGVPIHRTAIPDVSIYRQRAATATAAGAGGVAIPTWETTVEDTLGPDNSPDAVVIYQQRDESTWGAVVTRIELLSPSNKPGGSGYEGYAAKRSQALLGALPLVELDFLHQSPSPIISLPHYPEDENSHPYYIAVSDPRPEPGSGPVRVYGFTVDDSIPIIQIPLAGPDAITFDFGLPYGHAYKHGPWYLAVDYEQEPAKFSAYSPADQERIQQRMAWAQDTYLRGKDLESLTP